MDSTTALLMVFAATVLLLLPFEAAGLRQRAKDKRLLLTHCQSFGIAFFSITASFSLAAAVFVMMLLGPAWVVTDMTALPWITALPALIAGFWVARSTNKKLVSAAFNKLRKQP